MNNDRNAHFQPTYSLSLYLHGTAGSGKSSLVRTLFPAINDAISTHADPEILVRFVKQNLNKPYATLRLELELRPNNNDYSVMSIIQGRRMTLTQSKPGLVLVALEEMPSNVEGADPNQGEVAKLLSMRFSGRKGEFKVGGVAPRNSEKRGRFLREILHNTTVSPTSKFSYLSLQHGTIGISGDATIITIFTSNYNLEPPCLEALQRLDMFKNLTVVKVAPVSGKDRKTFALSYLTQRVKDSLAPWKGSVNIDLNITFGDGDTRPLVRYLRMLSFYIHALVLKSTKTTSCSSVDVTVACEATLNITTVTSVVDGSAIQLKPGSFQNLYTSTPPRLDSRASKTVAQLQSLHLNLQNASELSQILEFYFTKSLAPAVILSHDKELIHDLIRLLSQLEGVHGITNVDPSSYKMMKSLYDPSDTPNLRDDILQILHDEGSSPSSSSITSMVAVELKCHTTDAQLQIREIIEDSPSMTAFSTERSALYKDGLIFGVFVEGEFTPEIESRASLII